MSLIKIFLFLVMKKIIFVLVTLALQAYSVRVFLMGGAVANN